MSNSVRVIQKADRCKIDGKCFKDRWGDIDNVDTKGTIEKVLRGECRLIDIICDPDEGLTLEFESLRPSSLKDGIGEPGYAGGFG